MRSNPEISPYMIQHMQDSLPQSMRTESPSSSSGTAAASSSHPPDRDYGSPNASQASHASINGQDHDAPHANIPNPAPRDLNNLGGPMNASFGMQRLNQNPKEWKRYKQYSKSDLMKAIEEVKNGATALTVRSFSSISFYIYVGRNL